jgi:hypothetical protein
MALLSLLVGVVSLTKYLGLAVQDFANAPHFFLLFLTAPFFVAAAVGQRLPRTAAIITLLFGGLYSYLMVMQLVGGIEPYWGDYLLVFVGLPLALGALVMAGRVLLRR